MNTRGIVYESSHRDLIMRLAQIDAIGKRETLQPQYLQERRDIVDYLAQEGVLSLKEDGGFLFCGEFEGKNRLLYLDTLDMV